jgi:hypothetical protein
MSMALMLKLENSLKPKIMRKEVSQLVMPSAGYANNGWLNTESWCFAKPFPKDAAGNKAARNHAIISE